MEWEQKTQQAGLQEGVQQVGLKMIQKGMPLPEIVEFTGLSEEQVQALQQKS